MSGPKTQVGRRGATPKSSDSSNELTALVPERDRINPAAYMRWRDEVIAHEMGERVWSDK